MKQQSSTTCKEIYETGQSTKLGHMFYLTKLQVSSSTLFMCPLKYNEQELLYSSLSLFTAVPQLAYVLLFPLVLSLKVAGECSLYGLPDSLVSHLKGVLQTNSANHSHSAQSIFTTGILSDTTDQRNIIQQATVHHVREHLENGLPTVVKIENSVTALGYDLANGYNYLNHLRLDLQDSLQNLSSINSKPRSL
ncbi:hypothetical protein QL285_020711 [Trifolium repens]|nr:hypothetical protein QL285_020711 [Trifolium repens]